MTVVRTRRELWLVQPASPDLHCALVSYESSMLTEKALEGSEHLIPRRIRVGLELHLWEEGGSSGKERCSSYRKWKGFGSKEIPRVEGQDLPDTKCCGEL
jgi:transposase